MWKNISGQNLFHNSPLGLVLNKMDGDFVDVNEELLRIIGYSREEFLQLSFWDLVSSEDPENIIFNTLKRAKKYGPYEREYLHKKGHLVDVLLQGVLITDDQGEELVYSIVQDISRLKKAEKVLNKAQKMGNIGHWYFNLQTNEVSWSDETFRIFGLQPQEFDATYEAFLERIFPDDRESVDQAYTSSVEKETSYQIEHRVVRPNGEIRHVIERGDHFYDTNGNIIGSIGTVLDITEQKLNEEALLTAKNNAEEANIAKSSFIASISHELRTPLNAILGFSSQIATATNLSPSHRKNIELINRAGRHLLTMINEILDMSKIEAGEVRIQKSSFDFVNTLQNVIDLMSLELAHKSLDLIVDIDEGLPRFIRSDEGKLQQILLNIIGNAIKFTDKGFISVRVLSVILKDEKYCDYQVIVEDSGCGVEEHMLDRIFEPFVQNDGIKKVKEGTGLGLAISQNLSNLLGGKISVSSVVNKGSVFTISFRAELTEKPFPEFISPKESLSFTQKDNNIQMLEIEGLSGTIKLKIKEAALLGSRGNMRKQMAALEHTHPNLFKHLQKLVRNYDFDAIIELLQ